MSHGRGGIDAELSRLLREDRGRLLAALIADLGQFDLAEDALSEAVASALEHWGRSGVPDRPQGWLLRVARRKAIDQIRRGKRWRDRQATIEVLTEQDQTAAPDTDIPDERLRLIFTCCHPALDPKSQVALTLRSLCGLTTEEIARAFLDKPATMGQRLSRAKAKIAAAGIPYAVPGPDDWDDRLNSVLSVIYLVFNEGYAATSGEQQVRVDLCEEAIFLCRILGGLRDAPEIIGLLSLMLTTHARRAARQDATGALVPLDQQDRSLWDANACAEGLAALDEALKAGTPGPFQIKAAISALHLQSEHWADTDWRQMFLLYDALLHHEPSDVVRLNQLAVYAEVSGPEQALDRLDGLRDGLVDYQPYHALRADLLARTGRQSEAKVAYEQAIALSQNAAEREFLKARQSTL